MRRPSRSRASLVKSFCRSWSAGWTTLCSAWASPTHGVRRDSLPVTATLPSTVKRVDIPSYQVKPGDVIAVREKSRSSEKFKALIEQNGGKNLPEVD